MKDMKSFVTSYAGLFGREMPGIPQVRRIEIPLIQRDYAQGRPGKSVGRIRGDFIEALREAVKGGEPLGLDFVYGHVIEGTLQPLDGQQRLTTLFLLHWYLAFRTGALEQGGQPWQNFSYATRPSARLFCESLTLARPPADLTGLKVWIEDQPWFLYTWRHDPSIQSMLVVLDALHDRFHGDDCAAAWRRLVDPVAPAVSFHLLPMEDPGQGEDLYIKMNSRGKPLTPFENFKARFEQVLEKWCSPEQAKDFASRVDGPWSDVLWAYRGSNNLIDDEFMRYFEFATEVCEWREAGPASGDIEARAERIYGKDNPRRAEHLEFLFQAFDIWVGADIRCVFEDQFAAAGRLEAERVVLFGQDGQPLPEVDLFGACCRDYGESSGSRRLFSLGHTLLLYAVILQRIHRSSDFSRRVRVLRNLIEASANELREARMPALVADTWRIVVDGTLEGVAAFNQAQVADERLKAELLARHPRLASVLFRLEDLPVLRGCVAAFELDADLLESRTQAFCRLMAEPACWKALTGALLAFGDYARRWPGGRALQLGAPGPSDLGPWRRLLAEAGRPQLVATREVLGRLLDHVAQAGTDLDSCLDGLQRRWLQECEEARRFDWRYYFVKYSAMREGRSGIYYTETRGLLGYRVCMLDKLQLNSLYRDPYLQAILRLSGAGAAVERPLFTGYESQPRWMRLSGKGGELRCVDEGIELRFEQAHAAAVAAVCERHGLRSIDGARYLLAVPQETVDGRLVDLEDRVHLGSSLLQSLLAAEGLTAA